MTFNEFITSLGVYPPRDLIPGRWVRAATHTHARKKNAAIKLSEDGKVGWVNNFEHGGVQMWRAGDTDAPRESLEDMRERAALRRREEQRIQAKATAEALEHWSKHTFPLQGDHPYLKAKDLTMFGCAGLRIDRQNNLVVPMYINNKFASVQTITTDGNKKFWPSAPTKGASYTIGNGNITIFCEGLATGLTIYEAFAGHARVIVCFNAGNLANVVRKTNGLTIVAADDDRKTEVETGINPGVEAARTAANLHDCKLTVPDTLQSDFNDQLSERLSYWATKELGSYRKGLDFVRKKALADVKTTILKFIK